MTDDRCSHCKEFDLDGCNSCGPRTRDNLYGVSDLGDVPAQAQVIDSAGVLYYKATLQPYGGRVICFRQDGCGRTFDKSTKVSLQEEPVLGEVWVFSA
jgi:hypothetical protein